MGIYEFYVLSINDKAEFIWQSGSHLASVKETESTYLLYSTPNFYAEITMRENKIEEINSFRSGHRLDKYVDKIKLEKLI